MSNAVTLVIEGSQGEPGELVAETALRDPSPGDGSQGHQTLVSLARVLTVDVVALLAVQGSLLLYLVNKGRDQRVHLYSLPGENLKVERRGLVKTEGKDMLSLPVRSWRLSCRSQ